MKIAPFIVDVTPPVGFPIAYGINNKIHSRIYIRGLIIDDGNIKTALVSSDYISISGKAYWSWKKLIAAAIGTNEKNVFLHAIHQHDSIRIYLEIDELSRKYTGKEIFPSWYFQKVSDDLKKAVAESTALKKWKHVKNVAVSEKRMQGLASNRRLLGADGKVKAMRWSSSTPELQREQVGLIDPMLRTVAFLGKDGKVISALHYYATHPQSILGRNMVTSDVPGAALDYVGKHSDSKTFHIYFNGCGGNVTFGKYNLADKEKNPPDIRIKNLGEKLGKGILSNLQNLEKKELGKLSLKHVSFEFPLADKVKNPSLLELDKIIRKKVKPPLSVTSLDSLECRYMVIKKSWKKLSRPVISKLSIGNNIDILSFPAETVVEYQLYAQALLPEKFLACAAYGEDSYMYIPTAKMFEEGGYEPSASITSPEIEERYKEAIRKLLI